MKIRSPELYIFLVEKGVLEMGDEAIANAKAEYRRIYKKNWKQNKTIILKEVRPSFNPKQHYELTIKAHEAGLTPTAYIKQLALASIGQEQLIPHRDKLLKVLQLVGVTANLIHPHNFKYPFSQADEYIKEAESLLLEYFGIAKV